MSFATVLLYTGVSYLVIRFVLPLPSYHDNYMGSPITHKGALVLTLVAFLALCARMYEQDMRFEARLVKVEKLGALNRELNTIRQELRVFEPETPRSRQRLKELNTRLNAILEKIERVTQDAPQGE